MCNLFIFLKDKKLINYSFLVFIAPNYIVFYETSSDKDNDKEEKTNSSMGLKCLL